MTLAIKYKPSEESLILIRVTAPWGNSVGQGWGVAAGTRIKFHLSVLWLRLGRVVLTLETGPGPSPRHRGALQHLAGPGSRAVCGICGYYDPWLCPAW